MPTYSQHLGCMNNKPNITKVLLIYFYSKHLKAPSSHDTFNRHVQLLRSQSKFKGVALDLFYLECNIQQLTKSGFNKYSTLFSIECNKEKPVTNMPKNTKDLKLNPNRDAQPSSYEDVHSNKRQ